MANICLVKDGNCFEGLRDQVIGNVFRFWFDDKRTLWVHVKRFPKTHYHSYDSTWSEDAMFHDAVKFLLRKASEFGYRVYVEKEI